MTEKKNLATAILKAAQEPDPFRRRERIQECADFMRFRLGWTAAQCQRAAIKSGVSVDQWQELLSEIDHNP